MEEKDPPAVDPLEEIELYEPKRFTYVSSLLSNEENKRLGFMMLHDIDVFASRYSEMVGINLMVASHKLNILPTTKLVRQKVRRFHPDRHQIIHTKVDNFLATGL